MALIAVSTSVDVLGNDSALNNLSFDWSVSGGSENVKNATVLTHNLTGQKVLFCDLKEASHAIHQFHPSTVVVCNLFCFFFVCLLFLFFFFCQTF